jgi:hypothetical protein
MTQGRLVLSSAEGVEYGGTRRDPPGIRASEGRRAVWWMAHSMLDGNITVNDNAKHFIVCTLGCRYSSTHPFRYRCRRTFVRRNLR